MGHLNLLSSSQWTTSGQQNVPRGCDRSTYREVQEPLSQQDARKRPRPLISRGETDVVTPPASMDCDKYQRAESAGADSWSLAPHTLFQGEIGSHAHLLLPWGSCGLVSPFPLLVCVPGLLSTGLSHQKNGFLRAEPKPRATASFPISERSQLMTLLGHRGFQRQNTHIHTPLKIILPTQFS